METSNLKFSAEFEKPMLFLLVLTFEFGLLDFDLTMSFDES